MKRKFMNTDKQRSLLGGVLVCFVLTLLSSAVNAQYTWGSVAIGGGGFVSGIITSKTKQDLIYARTDVGGAYRWDAPNQKWIPLLDWVSEDELGYQGVESIAIDPKEPNKVYMLVGTSYFNSGKTAVLRSSDYGNTFSVTDVSAKFKAHGNGMGRQTGEKLQVDPNANDILFCGTRSDGLFKSPDAGVTWDRVSSLNITTTPSGNGISFVVLDPSTGSLGSPTQTLIAGISQTGTNLYRSNDGGASFTAIANAPTTRMPHRAVLTSDRNLYITYAAAAGPWDILGAGEIWKYNLTTGTWTNVTPAGFAGAFGGITVDPAAPGRLVASSINTYLAQDNSYGDRIFITDNAGTTWTDVVARGFDLDANGNSWINGNAIHWAGSIEFDPFDTQQVWVVSGNGVFRTTNIDALTNVWKFTSNGIEETVPLDLVSIPNGPLLSVIADYDGFRHTDITTYAPIHTPTMGTTTGIAYAAQNPNIALRVGDKMYYSTDMATTWTLCTPKGKEGSVAISADGAVFFHCPKGSTVTYRSVDNGATWTAVTGLSFVDARLVADPVNATKIYAYGNNTLMISTNAGALFTAAGSPGSGASKVIRATPGREGDVWVALMGNGLTRSVNSGTTFTSVSGVAYCGAVGFGKEAPGKTYPTVYIWGTVGGILGIHRSIDEGATWVRVNDNDHEYGGPANGQFVLGDMNVYGRVYMSTAGRGIVYGESNTTCIPTPVIPKMKINTGSLQQSTITTVKREANVVLSPEPLTGGTWSWTGPGGFTSTSREVTLTNLQVNQSGIYTAHYTNTTGCESAGQTFTITVSNQIILAQTIKVKGTGGATTIDQVGGTLQMLAEFTPANTDDQSVIWRITTGATLATISSTGMLTALRNGKVVVRATARDGSNVFGETEITLSNQLVTANETIADVEFLISPNPVTSVLVIQNASAIRHIDMLDLNGNVLRSQQNAEATMRFDLSGLSAGLYVMKILTRNQRSFIKKIVKN